MGANALTLEEQMARNPEQVRPQGKADFLVRRQCLSDLKRCLSMNFRCHSAKD